jgi:hypothetical protein
MSKENINVYWAPDYRGSEMDWSFLYPRPKKILTSLLQQKKNDHINISFFDSDASYLGCPAISSKFNNTYVFYNTLKSSYDYNFEDDNLIVERKGETGLDYTIRHTPSIKAGPVIEFSLSYIMFADKPLTATFTAPYFHPAGYTKYGSAVPGEFDIGQWFRPYLFEVQLWKNKGELVLEEEPIFYTSFPSDAKITLHRFNLTEKLRSYSNAGIGGNRTFGKGQTLISRYKRFKDVGMREKILTEISQNLIDDKL